MTLLVGIAGCGRAGRLHLNALRRAHGAAVGAVMDADPGAARAAAAEYGVERSYSDVDALVADDRLDVIAIATPPEAHAEVALAALAAGRHVLVEKPLTLDLAEADELIAAAGASDRVAAVGFNLRLHRQVAEARQAVRRGDLGSLRMIRHHWTAAARPAGWRADPRQGGGALWEMGIHQLDLWRHLTGEEPTTVRATGDDTALALNAQTPSGTVLATTVVSGTSETNEVELIGDRGRLTLTLYRGDGPRFSPAGQADGGAGVRLRAAAKTARTLPRQIRAAREGGDYLQSFAREWDAMRDAIAKGTPPHATLADGRAAVALATAAEQSLAAGEPAEVPA